MSWPSNQVAQPAPSSTQNARVRRCCEAAFMKRQAHAKPAASAWAMSPKAVRAALLGRVTETKPVKPYKSHPGSEEHPLSHGKFAEDALQGGEDVLEPFRGGRDLHRPSTTSLLSSGFC